MLKVLAAALAAAALTFAATELVGGGDSPTIKSAAASFASLPADETTHDDAVFVGPGLVQPFDTVLFGNMVIRKGFDLPATLAATRRAINGPGSVVKHVVCKTYYDAPVVNGVDDLGRATEYVTRCRLIRTSVEAAFERSTGYAEGSYKQTVARVRAER